MRALALLARENGAPTPRQYGASTAAGTKVTTNETAVRARANQPHVCRVRVCMLSVGARFEVVRWIR
jgi:hypothetical protein